MKPEAVLEWIKEHGVSGGAWNYAQNKSGYHLYKDGPTGILLTPVGGDEKKALFVPIRVWTFIKKRIVVTPKSEPSMFAVV